jgi:HEAT repeat protein
MTDDASPENLRKFLESDDPAMVRMGLSMAKGAGVEVTIKDLEHCLKSDNVETIKIGFAFAEEVGVGDEAMEMLCERLADDDYDVRYCAAKALGEIGEPAVEPIMGALREHYLWGAKDVETGMTGYMLAEEAGIGEMAIECICGKLEDNEPAVRKAAARTLGEIGLLDHHGFPERAVNPLIKALRDEHYHPRVRDSIWIALENIGWEPETDELRVVYLLAKSSARAPLFTVPGTWGESTVEPLIKALGGILWVRKAAASVLGKIGDERAVEPLIGALGDDDNVCRAAAWALGEIGDARAVEPLIKALGDGGEYVREAAAEALGAIGDARAVEPLIKALGNEDEDVRSHAAGALGEIGDARAVEPLIEALSDENMFIREAAAGALGDIGDKRAVEPLIGALSDDKTWVRRSAVEALGEIGDSRAVEPLIKALEDEDPDGRLADEDVHDAAKEALKKLGHEVE